MRGEPAHRHAARHRQARRSGVSAASRLAESDGCNRSAHEYCGLEAASDGFEIHIKQDQSPVTSADLAINQILHAHLLEAFPEDGWLSEESPESPVRLGKRRIWVIDPIDGTNAFIKREPEFCISVALVEDGHPVVAAIFNPSSDE
ncbi:MAG: hypothetical protein OEU87_01980 [Nitrospira sp.]|nr:hypothetical protein [Nitrospira sp.]